MNRVPAEAFPHSWDWALPLLRCPCCMSPLCLDDAGAVRCAGCERRYPLDGDASEERAIPRLRRDDTLATLDQDVVIYRQDPASTRLDYRRHIRYIQTREQFLAPLIGRASAPFDAAAARPGLHPRAPIGGGDEAFERFARLLGPAPIVLDLACGEGAWLLRLCELGVRVVGLDESRPSLVHAAEATAAQHGITAAFVEGNMMEMPLAAATFDGIWCSGAFAHVRVDRRVVLFRQMNRALRPGGIVFLDAPIRPLRAAVSRYLYWRWDRYKPVAPGEDVERAPRELGGGLHYRAAATARVLHALCHDHGFRVLALWRVKDAAGGPAGVRWHVLARKERGTDAG